MKPIEVLNIKDKTSNWGLVHTTEYLSEDAKGRHYLLKYLEQDCLVAYIEETLGTVLLIKGAREYFAYIIYNNRIKGGNIFRITLNHAYRVLNNPEYIKDNNLWEDFTKRLLVKSL